MGAGGAGGGVGGNGVADGYEMKFEVEAMADSTEDM